jgi:hypothetical protein
MWRTPTASSPWSWCRIYHRGPHCPQADASRHFGPLHRFDPHTPRASGPSLDTKRSVLYVGADLATSACEVFGEVGEALLCQSWKVALLRPTGPLTLFDLTAPGAAMAIGALPSLADGPHARTLTQKWARAIYEDDPLGRHVNGVRYRSAYNGGISIALWDADDSVSIVTSRDGLQDVTLTSPGMYERFVAELAARRITVSTIAAEDCPTCRRQALT